MDVDLPELLVGAVLGGVAGAFLWALAWTVRALWRRPGQHEDRAGGGPDWPSPVRQPARASSAPPAPPDQTAPRFQVAVAPPSRPPLTTTVAGSQPDAGPSWPVVTVSVTAGPRADPPVVANAPGPQAPANPSRPQNDQEASAN